MLPAILGLGGLAAKVAAAAVIPRIARAIRTSLGTTPPTRPPEPNSIEGTSSAPDTAQTPVKWSVSPPQPRSREFGYAGLFHHTPTGLDLATYRIYDSTQHRWLSRDPLGEGVDLNLYRYCGNDPMGYTDSRGLRKTDQDLYFEAKDYYIPVEYQAEVTRALRIVAEHSKDFAVNQNTRNLSLAGMSPVRGPQGYRMATNVLTRGVLVNMEWMNRIFDKSTYSGQARLVELVGAIANETFHMRQSWDAKLPEFRSDQFEIEVLKRWKCSLSGNPSNRGLIVEIDKEIEKAENWSEKHMLLGQ